MPIIRANDLVLSLDNNGEITIPYELIDNGSTDNCTIETYSIVSLNSDTVFAAEQEAPQQPEDLVEEAEASPLSNKGSAFKGKIGIYMPFHNDVLKAFKRAVLFFYFFVPYVT